MCIREKLDLEDIETEIPIDTSAESWISKLEEIAKEEQKKKRQFFNKRRTTQQGLGIYNGKIEGEDNIIKEILSIQKNQRIKIKFLIGLLNEPKNKKSVKISHIKGIEKKIKKLPTFT